MDMDADWLLGLIAAGIITLGAIGIIAYLIFRVAKGLASGDWN
jgi:hypothetical protein